jgi:hypothetical protein
MENNNDERDRFVLHAGDVVSCATCGCCMTVESGPHDDDKARHAVTCCCGNAMERQPFGLHVPHNDIPQELAFTPVTQGG